MFAALEAYADQIVAFVKENQAWAAPIVFALAFGESLAFISLLLPAWAALVGIGTLIMASGLNFWPIWIAASVGAALGDWLSYWIGLKLERTVYNVWPLSRHPEVIPKAEKLHGEVGRARHLHRALLRAAARDRPAHRRHFRDAVLALPVCELDLRIPVGRGSAAARRRGVEGIQVFLGLNRRRRRVPAEPGKRLGNALLPASARRCSQALAICFEPIYGNDPHWISGGSHAARALIFFPEPFCSPVFSRHLSPLMIGALASTKPTRGILPFKPARA